MDTQSGQTSGRQFHLKELIGEGAFGEVYLAEQDSGAGFRRKVAIKLLHTDVAEMSKDAGRRMRDEARILGRLSHRNIVAVLDLIKLGDRWAIIMDYVPGADLEMVLEALNAANETFPAPAALEIGTAILNALDAVFTADDGNGNPMGVIHRDIKPSNVRLTVDGEVKVLDFGVARVNMDTREAQTRASGWIGTERYMSPERILCEGDGAAGDVYAAVSSIVELLLGRPLGRTPVLKERHDPWIEAALQELDERMNDSPDNKGVIEWMRRGLACEPEDRPTARELSDALGPLARTLPGDGVEAFSRRFMPSIDGLLGHQRQPATGILSESGTTAPNRTIAIDDESDPPAAGTTRSGPSTLDSVGSRTVVVGAIGVGSIAFVGVVVLILLAFLIIFGIQKYGQMDPTTVATAPPVAPTTQSEAPPTDGSQPAGQPDEQEEPSAQPEAAPTPEADPMPAVAADPAPVAAPTAPVSDAAPVPVAAPGAPVIRGALVVLPDASSITVQCSGVEGQGTATARIRNFPAGPCQISVLYLNNEYKTTTSIERPGEVKCAVSGGNLKCS